MSTLSSWNNLPGDILREVFAFVKDTSTEEEFTECLYETLFVCKSWSYTSRFRKYNMYEYMDLTLSDVPYFASEVRLKPYIGPLVKSVNIRLNSAEVEVERLDEYLKTILRCCPNLEAFGSTSNVLEPLVTWRLLSMVEKAHHKNIKRISLADQCIPTSNQYTSLSFKFIDSLTELQMCPEVLSDRPVIEATNCIELKKRLNEFKSLTHLQLWGNSVGKSEIVTEVDSLIDSYLCKIPSLELRECYLLRDQDFRRVSNPNSSVKKLQLTDCRVSARAFDYFAAKLQGLEEFTMTTEFRDFEVPEAAAPWWGRLTNICQNVSHYEISIKKFNLKTYLNQIRGCVALSNTLAQGTTELTMALGKRLGVTDYTIEMKQNRSSIRLFDCIETKNAFIDSVFITEAFKSLKPCSIKTIKVLDANAELRPGRVETYLKSILKETDEKKTIKSLKRFWCIFNGAMSLIDGKLDSVVHLDKLFLYRRGAGEQTASIDTSISELKLTNCVFYYDSFLKMSSRLPKVDKLIISRCIFMTKHIYQINIDLPETKLGCLELYFSSIFDSDRIIFLGKCHTIAVNIGDTTTNYVFDRDDKHTYQTIDNGPEELPKSPADFHIVITCKELQSLSISDVVVF
ncbi:hypothetical protein [Parasitella parasitica]|uniref:Uncharacterized protein n=1 Tax=Parasitella parasitica TaxID=35722 RepID=A0A0B7N915_9FUNG|nr:hypothetical protein [Parasitella parasitica]